MTEKNPNDDRRILWTHNFPKIPGGGGVWMYNQYEFVKDKVDLYYMNDLRNPIWFILHLFRLRRISKKYEIVHAQYGSAVGFLTSFAKAIRIVSLKGSDWYKAPGRSIFDRLRIFLGSALTKFALLRSNHVIVMSDAMRSMVVKKFPETRITTIVDPIDIENFVATPENRQRPVKRVLFASSTLHNPIKRFSLAKKAVSHLQKRMENVELVVMTKVPYDKVSEFMNATDVLLLTSTHEGWPNVVKEMLALDKPFVSTDVSDLAAVASKTNSCYVCTDDFKELGDALFKSLNAPKEDLRYLVESYSMESALSTLYKVYDQYSRP